VLKASALWILIPSALATAFCWRRIWRAPEPMFLRVVNCVLAAVPVLGPVFYVLGNISPPRPMRFQHSLGTFFGELSVEKLASLLSQARKSDNQARESISATTGAGARASVLPKADPHGRGADSMSSEHMTPFRAKAFRAFGIVVVVVLGGLPIWFTLDMPVGEGELIAGQVQSGFLVPGKSGTSERLYVRLVDGRFAQVDLSSPVGLPVGAQVVVRKRLALISRRAEFNLVSVVPTVR
jgi:hypothetical protein